MTDTSKCLRAYAVGDEDVINGSVENYDFDWGDPVTTPDCRCRQGCGCGGCSYRCRNSCGCGCQNNCGCQNRCGCGNCCRCENNCGCEEIGSCEPEPEPEPDPVECPSHCGCGNTASEDTIYPIIDL